MFRTYLIVIFCVLAFFANAQDPLKQAVFTQIVNDVEVVKPNDSKARTWPKVKDVFALPDLIQTGALSRAELIADDKTVTRVGANTIFSFSKEDRGIDLKQGTVLFHSPEGKGGGTIRTAGATAAVTGTTIAVCATSNGGFKLLVFEGKAKATLSSGRVQNLVAGQLVFIFPGRAGFSPVITFDVQRCVEGSKLHTGFSDELPSKDKIQKVSDKQKKEIKEGKATGTDVLVADALDDKSYQTISSSSLEPLLGDSALIASMLSTDVKVNNSTLDSTHVILFKSIGFQSLVDINDSKYTSSTSIGFLLGKNIYFNYGSIDLSQYNTNLFGFLAAENIDFSGAGSYSFNSNGSYYTGEIGFLAGQKILGLDNKYFSSPYGLHFESSGSIDASGTSFYASYGELSIETEGSLNLSNTSIYAKDISLEATGSSSSNYINYTLSSMSVTGDLNMNANGNIDFVSTSGLVAASASRVNINSHTGNITITDILFNASGATVNINAQNRTSGVINVTTNTPYSTLFASNLSSVSMAARTINFTGINFALGVPVNLTTAYGWNVSGSSIPGYANFINSKYNGTSIDSYYTGYQTTGTGYVGASTIHVNSGY